MYDNLTLQGVDNNLLYVVDGQREIRSSFYFPNGLVAAGPGFAQIYTAIKAGPVVVRVKALDRRPAEIDTPWVDDWEDIVEISVEAFEGQLRAVEQYEGTNERPSSVLTIHGPGWYRLRVHAMGRDLHPDHYVQYPTENYLLQMWPAPQAADTEHRAQSQFIQQAKMQARNQPPPEPPFEFTETCEPFYGPTGLPPE